MRSNQRVKITVRKRVNHKAMNEVDVCYMKRKVCQGRKFKRYSDDKEAMDVFDKTVKKFRNERTEALIVFRVLERGFWKTIKSELV